MMSYGDFDRAAQKAGYRCDQYARTVSAALFVLVSGWITARAAEFWMVTPKSVSRVAAKIMRAHVANGEASNAAD